MLLGLLFVSDIAPAVIIVARLILARGRKNEPRR